MEHLTLFTWGYWGWGSATGQLIEAVDAVEMDRGYEPPLFVDIRISRSVRARGFDGSAFENAVGVSRYRWLDVLGNAAVKGGGAMRIMDPAAADTLLDIALACARNHQRILFFCACEFPATCHRSKIADLVFQAAGHRKLPVQVVEWPGGEPRLGSFEVQLSKTAFEKVYRGGKSIPLDDPVPLAEMAAVPWYSLVLIRHNKEQKLLVTGPIRYRKGGWYLPSYGYIEPDEPANRTRRHIQEARARDGFEPLRTQP